MILVETSWTLGIGVRAMTTEITEVTRDESDSDMEFFHVKLKQNYIEKTLYGAESSNQAVNAKNQAYG